MQNADDTNATPLVDSENQQTETPTEAAFVSQAEIDRLKHAPVLETETEEVEPEEETEPTEPTEDGQKKAL